MYKKYFIISKGLKDYKVIIIITINHNIIQAMLPLVAFLQGTHPIHGVSVSLAFSFRFQLAFCFFLLLYILVSILFLRP